ncbi:DUF2497 domain-containing protein [Sphingomonas sp. 28-63-12]|uniref:DUF2497 domain-containing protein n=1 Tax=Sphingomonas sp. 28-63-12 TaxID=1970434 RepID=UPI000BD09EAF|nr:MAG: hypothetical protein B7Y47_14095 [Sphingomonas sp. 28-63-12]
MGDLSVEPSMEDILSSIKRIIAEDGDSGSVVRSRRAPRTPPAPAAPASTNRSRLPDPGDVLELSNPVTDDAEDDATLIERVEAALSTDSILSESAAQASRGALDTLSRMVVKPAATPAPEAQAPETLEGLVREMLRPMLREWLDSKLPGMVEDMVAREIARITQGR